MLDENGQNAPDDLPHGNLPGHNFRIVLGLVMIGLFLMFCRAQCGTLPVVQEIRQFLQN